MRKKIPLHGEGDQMPGVETGDVIIVLDQKQHDLFTRKGNDLHIEKTINLNEALTGTQISIEHLDKRKYHSERAQG